MTDLQAVQAAWINSATSWPTIPCPAKPQKLAIQAKRNSATGEETTRSEPPVAPRNGRFFSFHERSAEYHVRIVSKFG